MKFTTAPRTDELTENFHVWIATRNSQYRETITLIWEGKARDFTVATDKPHILIGVTAYEGRYTYELLGPDDLQANVVAEIQDLGWEINET